MTSELEQEIWKPVPGYWEKYRVSNLGRVGFIGSSVMLSQRIVKNGGKDSRGERCRLCVTLYDGRVPRRWPVHHLVLLAFHGPRPEGALGRHLNDDYRDNRAVNLKWGTRHENAADAKANGVQPKGERHGRAKLTETAVKAIKALVRMGLPMGEIASTYDVTRQTVQRIAQGKAWAHLDERAITMQLQDYPKAALSTAMYPGKGEDQPNAEGRSTVGRGLNYVCLKLSGEVGEFNEKVGKTLRDNDGVIDAAKREALKLELGDVLWYVNAAAMELGMTLEEVAAANIAKLESRNKRGVIQGSGDTR